MDGWCQGTSSLGFAQQPQTVPRLTCPPAASTAHWVPVFPLPRCPASWLLAVLLLTPFRDGPGDPLLSLSLRPRVCLDRVWRSSQVGLGSRNLQCAPTSRSSLPGQHPPHSIRPMALLPGDLRLSTGLTGLSSHRPPTPPGVSLSPGTEGAQAQATFFAARSDPGWDSKSSP